MWHEPLIRVTRLWTLFPHSGRKKICATWPLEFVHVLYDAFMRVWHDAFKCVWQEPLGYSCIWVTERLCAHDSLKSLMWARLNHTCVVWPNHMSVTWCRHMYVTWASSLLLHPGRTTSVRHDSFLYMWYDPLIRVTWPIHMCDTTLNPTPATGSPNICATWPIESVHVWYDPFMCVTHDRFICEWHDPFICVRHESLRYSCIQDTGVVQNMFCTTFVRTSSAQHLWEHVLHNICEPWLIQSIGVRTTHSYMCDMSHWYVSDKAHSYVCDMNRFATPASRIQVLCRTCSAQHLCAMTHSIRWCAHDSFIHVCHDSFICVRHDLFMCVWHDSPFHMSICFAQHLFYKTHSYMLHNSSTHVWQTSHVAQSLWDLVTAKIVGCSYRSYEGRSTHVLIDTRVTYLPS